MTMPSLFYITPEWGRHGSFARDSLVWNALDGHHEQIASWTESLKKRRSLVKGWEPPSAMLEKGAQGADFLAACRATFAVKPAAWKLIQDLANGSAETLPVKVTHVIEQDEFDFTPIPRASQPNYLLLHGLFDVPLRHGQRGSWDVNRNRYDMSMGKFYGAPPELCRELWLDPDEIAGKHLFLLQGEWVASADFVNRVRSKKLSGLEFHPIRYVSKPSPAQVQAKQVLPAPPKPDFSAASKGYSPQVGKQWQALWDWTVQAFQNRHWPARKTKLKPPLPVKKLRDFESKYDIQLPRDYADVLTQLASEVTVDLGWVEPKDPIYRQREVIERRIRELMFGGTLQLWSFSVPLREYAGFKKWGDAMADEESDSEYHQHFRNKLPILQIANGDYIAVDLKSGVPTYLSHEGDDDLQGKPLGKNFVDFITRWSWTCLPWPDFLPGTGFYDKRSKQLPESSPALNCWHAWLRGVPLPAEKG